MGAAASPRRLLLERLRFLHQLGVESLPRTAAPMPARGQEVVVAGAVAAATMASSRPATPASGMTADLAQVRQDLGDCSRCRLSESRTKIVFGVGDPAASLMFIGEAPGQDEDRQGEPFVGRAGQLLDRMIASIGLRREEVYIANVVKCRPPGNRNPQADEIEACAGFLAAQVEAVHPAVIVALGKFAASTLLSEEIAITRARGQMRSYRGIPLMLTFHPAYLLRQYTQENRRAVFDDLLQVKALLGQAGS